jgi:hypothetical protein
MTFKKLVELLTGETEVLGENLPQVAGSSPDEVDFLN